MLFRSSAIREVGLGVRDERGVPQAHQDTRCEVGLPVRLRRDDLVHELEQPRRVVLHLHNDIKLDVAVLGLGSGSATSAAPN